MLGTLLPSGTDTYEIREELGRGAFGDTWKAVRASDGAVCVVKTLRIDRVDDWKAVELFGREAAVLASLDHPNIPRYIDHFDIAADAESGRAAGFAIVQEFVDGQSLRDRMRAGHLLEPAELRRLFARLTEICGYLHGRVPPVLHRDINPNNVMLRHADGEPVLVDFGTVQHALRSAGSIASTAAGTFGYAPMEQFVGRSVPASDLYGVAMTILAVATGREPEELPFAANRVLVRDALRDVGIDARLLLALEALTEPDAARRPQTAAEVLERLGTVGEFAPTADAGRNVALVRGGDGDATPVGEAGRAAADAYRAQAAAAERVSSTRALRVFEHPGAAGFNSVGFTRDGRYAVLGPDLVVVDLLTMRPVPTPLRGPRHGVERNVVVASDGPGALVDDEGFTLHVLRRGRLEAVPMRLDWAQGPRARVSPGRALAIEPHGLLAAFWPDSTRIAYLDGAEGRVLGVVDVRSWLPTAGTVRDAGFDPHGVRVFAAISFGMCFVTRDGQVRSQSSMGALAWSPDGERVVFGLGGAVHTQAARQFEWIGREGTQQPPLRLLWRCHSPIQHLAWSATGSLIAAAPRDRGPVVLDPDNGRVIVELDTPFRPGRPLTDVRALGFTADETRLLVHARMPSTAADGHEEPAVGVYSLVERAWVGVVSRVESRDRPGRLVVALADGLGAELTPGVDDESPLWRRLRGDAPAACAFSEDADAIDDLAVRTRFFTGLLASGRLPTFGGMQQAIDASAGLSHMLDAIVHDAEHETNRRNHVMLPTLSGHPTLNEPVVLACIERMRARSPDERAVMVEQRALEVAREADRVARAAERRGGWGRSAAIAAGVSVAALAAGGAASFVFAAPLLVPIGVAGAAAGLAAGAVALGRRRARGGDEPAA